MDVSDTIYICTYLANHKVADLGIQTPFRCFLEECSSVVYPTSKSSNVKLTCDILP